MSAFNTAESEPGSEEARLLESYRPASGAFDELSSVAGVIRPRWRNVLEAFAGMGADATQAAQEKAKQLLLENGVTFAAQDEGDGSRPWRLDLFPVLIDPEEWTAIERGVTQRARLLNELLVDLYGEQRVLKQRILPPGLVFGNPQFLRPGAVRQVDLR